MRIYYKWLWFVLHNTGIEYNFKISITETKLITFRGTTPVRSKLILNNESIKHVNKFKCFGCTISYLRETDINRTVGRCKHMCDTTCIIQIKYVQQVGNCITKVL
jgi:hypothetical protein